MFNYFLFIHLFAFAILFLFAISIIIIIISFVCFLFDIYFSTYKFFILRSFRPAWTKAYKIFGKIWNFCTQFPLLYQNCLRTCWILSFTSVASSHPQIPHLLITKLMDKFHLQKISSFHLNLKSVLGNTTW